MSLLAAPLVLLALSVSGCGDAKETRPAVWSYIYPAIIEPSCATASCHSTFAKRAGVDLGDIGEAHFQFTKRFYVSPAHPEDSAVLYLMRAQGARRMPPDFALPNVDIELVSTWIANGAQDD